MSHSTSLAIPYELDFEVHYTPGPLWSVGGDVLLRVELSDPPGAGAADTYSALVTSFFMLASTGAMCGGLIEPWRSELADFEPLTAAEKTLSYRLRGAWLDEGATVVCANMIALGHEAFPIRKVSIIGSNSPAQLTQRLAYDGSRADPYPALYKQLPFRCDFEPSQDAPHVTIALVKAIDSDSEETLRAQILTWAAACAGGCYAAVLAAPSACYIAFDPNDIEVLDDVAYVSIAKFRCHEAALVGLVNACAALHPDVLIASVSVE